MEGEKGMIRIMQTIDLSLFETSNELCLELKCKQCGHGDHIISKSLNGRDVGGTYHMHFWFVCTVHTPDDPCCGGYGPILEEKNE